MKGAIFDVDGTLLDSMDIWVKVDKIYLHRHDIEATPALSRLFFNMTFDQSIAYMRATLGIKDSPAQIKHDMLKIVADFYAYEVPLKPHMKEIIDAFKRRHLPMAIATSNSKNIIEQALSRLDVLDDFTYILTCDEAGCDKNTPDIYLQAAAYTNSAPENTYVFEDALHAAISADQGGFIVVGIYDDYSKNYQDQLKRVSQYYLRADEDYSRFIAAI